MPIYMDRHYIEGATRHAMELAHEKDMAIQEKYGVNFMTYWFDEDKSTAFCLVDAPDKDAVCRLHGDSHGSIPHEIIEVDPSIVESFLGRISDPPRDKKTLTDAGKIDSAFRTIMFTDLKDSTAITSRLGDTKAMHLLRIHNALTRNAIREHDGREVKHTGDGLMVSFTSAQDAVSCTSAIQDSFQDYNRETSGVTLHVRIGLSAGEPVEENGDLFGSSVQLAARICAHAKPDSTLISQVVREHCQDGEFTFIDRGLITLQGISSPVNIFEVD